MLRAIITSGTLALREIAGRPARALLLVITLVVAVAAWLGMAALAAPFMGTGDAGNVVDAGITVRNARGTLDSMASLPKGYEARIAALPGVRGVSYMDVLPVICRSPSTTATLNAIGGPATRRFLQRRHVDPELAARWNADRLGILVGAKLAASCGWRAGMAIAPKGLTDQPVEIHITGIFHGSADASGNIAIAHYAYVNELGSLAGRDRVLMITAYPRNPRDANAMAAQIDAAFAASDPPVTATTNTTTATALSRFGKVQQLLALVMIAVFLCALLVFVSVLAHAAAERRRIMAVMQVLGFSRPALFRTLLLEFLVVVLIGAGLGVGAGFGVIAFLRNADPFVNALFGGFAAPPWAWRWLVPWLLLLLGAALIGPALTIARLRPRDYQRT